MQSCLTAASAFWGAGHLDQNKAKVQAVSFSSTYNNQLGVLFDA